MTVVLPATETLKAYFVQALMLLSVNIPTLSFGLALGWVSLASGSTGTDESEGAVVAGAAATCAAGLLAVPLAARALRQPRRYVLAATSAAFAICWALTWCGGWWLVAGRVCAGVAGALAWTLAPVLGPEACQLFPAAAAAAPVLAHAGGMLLMYLAGYLRPDHSTVVWSCLALSVLHSVVALLTPEPASTSVAEQTPHRGLWAQTKDLLSDGARRRAFIIALVAVAGQEACGLLSLLQFAERVFLLAGGEKIAVGVEKEAAHTALLLGAVQFVAAAISLILLERVPRRPLLVWCAGAAGICLAAGATAVAVGASETATDQDGWNKTADLGGNETVLDGTTASWSRTAAAVALCAAVAADALGLQPAPYALLYDMFQPQCRGCAVLLVMGAVSAANAAETLIFPALARFTGLPSTLAIAAGLTLFYTGFIIIYVPETKDKTVDEIYGTIYPGMNKSDEETADKRHVTEMDKFNIKDRNMDDIHTIVSKKDKHAETATKIDVTQKEYLSGTKDKKPDDVNHTTFPDKKEKDIEAEADIIKEVNFPNTHMLNDLPKNESKGVLVQIIVPVTEKNNALEENNQDREKTYGDSVNSGFNNVVRDKIRTKEVKTVVSDKVKDSSCEFKENNINDQPTSNERTDQVGDFKRDVKLNTLEANEGSFTKL